MRISLRYRAVCRGHARFICLVFQQKIIENIHVRNYLPKNIWNFDYKIDCFQKFCWSNEEAVGKGGVSLNGQHSWPLGWGRQLWSHTLSPSSLRCDHSVTQDPGPRTPGWPWLLGSELEDYGKRSAAAALASLAVAAIRGDERQKTGLAGGWRLAAAAAHWNIILSTRGSGARLHLGHCTSLQTRQGLESICINMCYSDSENVQSIEICQMRWWAMAMHALYSVSICW